MQDDIVIVGAARTPVGAFNGAFANLPAHELGKVAIGYYIGAGLMIAGGLVEVFLGVDAEQKSLEDVAEPLSSQDADESATS